MTTAELSRRFRAGSVASACSTDSHDAYEQLKSPAISVTSDARSPIQHAQQYRKRSSAALEEANGDGGSGNEGDDDDKHETEHTSAGLGDRICERLPSFDVPPLCICRPEPHIPRPKNSFMLYRQFYQASIASTNPNLGNPEISKLLAARWHNESNTIQAEWKRRAEDEKIRHHQQHPEYRYKPRRNRKTSNGEISVGPSSTTVCPRCGGHTMISPGSPPTATARPLLPPPEHLVHGSDPHARTLPPMSALSLASPSAHGRRNSRLQHASSLVAVPSAAYRQYHPEEDRYGPRSPDAKRVRYANSGAYGPASIYTAQRGPYSPYPLQSPYRSSSSSHDIVHTPRYSNMVTTLPTMPPNPRPTGVTFAPAPFESTPSAISLPPIPAQPQSDPSKSVEAMVMSIPYLSKLRILNRVAPTLRIASSGLSVRGRGTLIAIEGDDPSTLVFLRTWLAQFLAASGDNNHVQTGAGPASTSSYDRELSIADYHRLIQDWHDRGTAIANFLLGHDEAINEPASARPSTESHDEMPSPKSTVPPRSSGTGAVPSTAPHASSSASVSQPPSNRHKQANPNPVLILERYQLHASNVFASRIPIADSYNPVDHWQWMATLWRGVIGADLVVYVRDAVVAAAGSGAGAAANAGGPSTAGTEDAGREGQAATTAAAAAASTTRLSGSGVEVLEGERCIVVTRDVNQEQGAGEGKSGGLEAGAAAKFGLDEKRLRRLGFEVGEWVRGVAQGQIGNGAATENAGSREGARKMS